MARAPTVSDLRGRVEAIQASIDVHEREIDKLRAQKALLIEMLEDRPQVPAASLGRAQKGSVKSTVLQLLAEVGAAGLNANSAVTLADKKGIRLERGSVSSLLSRLKNDGIVTYSDDRYRLPQGVSASNISQIRTSGGTVFD